MKVPENRESDIESDKSEHFKRLQHLLEDFSDDIPEQWMSGSEGSQYKVKMGWWQALIDTLDLVNMEVIADPVLKSEIEAFVSKYSDSGMTHVGTTQKNINEANALIRKVIENLQNSV
ncbi:hypothetical protein JW752_00540 [Candidatus Peregrinibacteria bacterium]|nr:hypothetical protein [Candidatus Peregrinibacteria bacterium]